MCDYIVGCLAIYRELQATGHIQLYLALDVKHALYGRGLYCKTWSCAAEYTALKVSVIPHHSGVGKGRDTVGSGHYHIPALLPWQCYYWASGVVRMGTCCKDWVLLSLPLSISPGLAPTSFISYSGRVGSGLSIGPVAPRHLSQVPPFFLPQLFQTEKDRGTGLFCKVCEMKWGEMLWKSMALIIYLDNKGTLDGEY